MFEKKNIEEAGTETKENFAASEQHQIKVGIIFLHNI